MREMESQILTEKRLSTMEQKMDNLKEDLNEVKSDVKGIAQDIKDHVQWEADKYEKLDAKYSGKWVEKAIIGIASGLIVSIVAGLFMILVKR